MLGLFYCLAVMLGRVLGRVGPLLQAFELLPTRHSYHHNQPHSMTEPTNILADFPPDRFRILCACSACNRTNWLDRSVAPESMSINELRERATCRACGSRNCGIRIVYAGSGEYSYG